MYFLCRLSSPVLASLPFGRTNPPLPSSSTQPYHIPLLNPTPPSPPHVNLSFKKMTFALFFFFFFTFYIIFCTFCTFFCFLNIKLNKLKENQDQLRTCMQKVKECVHKTSVFKFLNGFVDLYFDFDYSFDLSSTWSLFHLTWKTVLN